MSSKGINTVLSHELLSHNLLEFLTLRSLSRARLASRAVKGHLEPPEVPKDLLELVPCRLHIKREVTLTRLEALAKRKSSQALRAIVARLGDKDEFDHLRLWTLNSVWALAEPGDAWAVNAIMGPSGPLECGGTAVKEAALRMLMELATVASGELVGAAARALAYTAVAKDCLPLKVQARAALEHFAKQAAGRVVIDDSTLSALLALLDFDGVEMRCSAIRALSILTPRGNSPVSRCLLKALQRQGHEKSAKEQLCAVKALEHIACKGDDEVIQALSAYIEAKDTSFLGGQLPQAVLAALKSLSGA